ncbi:MAG: hypothetical protein ACREVB_02270, partial [Burkholderiales bacterium]
MPDDEIIALAERAGITSPTDVHAIGLICDSCREAGWLDPQQFTEVALRFLVWTGLQDITGGQERVAQIVSDGLRSTARWMRRQLGGAAGVRDLDVILLTTIRDAETHELGTEVVAGHFAQECLSRLREVAHSLSKSANDDVLRG